MPQSKHSFRVRLLAAVACLLCVPASAAQKAPVAKVGGDKPGASFVPVYRTDFPDPHVVRRGAELIAYSTNSEGVNLPMATSRDLVTWTAAADAAGKPKDGMPVLASWVQGGKTWAPEVMKIGDKWMLYYTAAHKKRGVQCVGVAVAAEPLGPFRDDAAEPMVCQYDGGGTIDAHPFRDADGQLYLYYKNDGNNPKVLKTSQIWVRKMSADGLRLEGAEVPLVRNDVHWEWRVVEAPTMVRHDDGYTLFFSANHFGWEADQRLSNYGTGYASCKGPMGPCTDAKGNPWLHSFNDRNAGCISGPGHPAVFDAGGRTFMAFHGWSATAGCRKMGDKRFLYVAPLSWKDGKPQVGMSLRPAAK